MSAMVEKGRWRMQRLRVVRLGAVCAILYFLLFVAEEIYAFHIVQPPSNVPKATDAAARVLLRYFHQHPNWLISTTVFSVASGVLLLGVASGVFAFFKLTAARYQRLALGVATASCVLSAVLSLYIFATVSSAVNLFAVAKTAAQQHSAVDSYVNAPIVLDYLSAFSTILLNGLLWLAIIGVSLIRLYGNRSVLGWVTIGAAVLSMSRILPALPLWCAAASYYLLRENGRPSPPMVRRHETLNDNGEFQTADFATMPARERGQRRPRAAPPSPQASSAIVHERLRGTSESRQRPAAARGSKSSRRKRR